MELLTVICGDALEKLRELPDESVQCCVTSPPYWGLRDYGVEGQLGLEKTPEEYVSNLVQIFHEVRRVLKKNGTMWLNIGDSYAAGGRGGGSGSIQQNAMGREMYSVHGFRYAPNGYKPKDLVGIPWMVAFGLRYDGWYLRSDIICE